MRIERRPERGEGEQKLITHLCLTGQVVDAIAYLHDRASRLHYHDLMVLLGPQRQAGSVRLVTHSTIALNPQPYAPFPDVIDAASPTLDQYRIQYPDGAILGIGTAVGILADIPPFLRLYDLYYAGGDELHQSRTQFVQKYNQGRFYAQGRGGGISIISADRIFLVSQ